MVLQGNSAGGRVGEDGKFFSCGDLLFEFGGVSRRFVWSWGNSQKTATTTTKLIATTRPFPYLAVLDGMCQGGPSPTQETYINDMYLYVPKE